VTLMRAAADREDNSEKHVAMENRLYPMRELLADLLLEQGDAAAALIEYEASMTSAPERVRGFYGAAKAAEAVGDKARQPHIFANSFAWHATLTVTAPRSAKPGISP
jgi:hypothetical protein